MIMLLSQTKKVWLLIFFNFDIPVSASNVVYINHEGKQSLLVPSGWPNSMKIIREQVENDGINIIELENSQLSKVDGCLTCKSVLF